MFEKWRIREHMEVTDSAGAHVGTVDSVENGRIKLTRADAGDAAHHYLDLDAVDRIDDGHVYMKAGTPLPATLARPAAACGSDLRAPAPAAAGADFASSGPSPTHGPQGADAPLFGTSGHGTGMGGAGTS